MKLTKILKLITFSTWILILVHETASSGSYNTFHKCYFATCFVPLMDCSALFSVCNRIESFSYLWNAAFAFVILMLN